MCDPQSPKASQSVLDVFLAWVRNGAASEQSRAELVPALMGRLLAQPIPLKLQTGIFHIFASLAEQGTCCCVCGVCGCACAVRNGVFLWAYVQATFRRRWLRRW